ncbi:MAG: hypothetical protein M1133_09125 [Armatimonadetes bacterium]|nr:hypothetical protein [Armatimonadota bacterium]
MKMHTRYLTLALLVALTVSASATIAASKTTAINAEQPAPVACSACKGTGMQCGAKGDMMKPSGMPMMPMMQMMQTMHPAITVDASDVYVVRGNEIIKLDKVSLKVIASTMLPAPSQPTDKMGGMTGSGPGMKGCAQCGMKGGMMGDGMGPGGMPMMQMMQTMHPAITVDASAIYIVRGGEVIKLDKGDLRVLAQTTLPPMESAGKAGSMDDMAPK